MADMDNKMDPIWVLFYMNMQKKLVGPKANIYDYGDVT